MATWMEFDNAVGATRGGDASMGAKKWPDAKGGAYGGANAGPVESYSPGSEFDRGAGDPHLYSPIVTPAPAGPDGEFGYVRADRSEHAHFAGYSASDFDSGAINTCSGDAQVAKMWPDAACGGLGSSTDGYKD
jgi:hypothetical protein